MIAIKTSLSVLLSALSFTCVHAQVNSLPAAATGINSLQEQAEKPNAGRPDATYYRISIEVREVDGGRILNSRGYELTTRGGSAGGMIRSSSRVAYDNGMGGLNNAEVGVNIDCTDIRANGSEVGMMVRVDVTNLANMPEGTTLPQTRVPLVRTFQWKSDVTVPLRKATTIYSSDDPASKRQMQVVVTVLPVKS